MVGHLQKIFLLAVLAGLLWSQEVPAGAFAITRLHYDGGGDWYSDPSSLPNLLAFLDSETSVIVDPIEKRARIGDDVFFESPYLYMTGHGNIRFTDEQAQMLRDHILNGAFLHADDNYGMDKSFRTQMKKVFPEKDWVEIPPDHDLFTIRFPFPGGLPKIHEHDNQRPQALGLFHEGKLIVLYTYECDLGDGWEDGNVHNDPAALRTQALQMGSNIVLYALSR